MPHSLFISDLHLCASRPAITAAFIRFLQNTAKQAENLFILGDLFEYWAGDDDLGSPEHQAIIQALKAISDAGTQLYFIHGNRDFLIAQAFAKATDATLLKDPSKLKLYENTVLLSHGDALCTDDINYQAFRTQVRSPAWQNTFLAQALSERKAQIEALRLRSEQEKSYKTADIMDVNQEAVAALVREYQYPALLIHGHTHRPAVHTLSIDGKTCQRIVLGDWYEQGSCLRLDSTGFSNIPVKI